MRCEKCGGSMSIINARGTIECSQCGFKIETLSPEELQKIEEDAKEYHRIDLDGTPEEQYEYYVNERNEEKEYWENEED